MTGEERSPLDQALDVLVYAPVGLALTAQENLSELIDKGRQRVSAQVATARMIGQFAVAQGEREARKLLTRASDMVPGARAGPARSGEAADGGPGASPSNRAAAAGESAIDGPADIGHGRRRDAGAAGRAGAAGPGGARSVAGGAGAGAGTGGEPAVGLPTGPARSSAHLAIPGYDTLSASQVVQRLGGLAREELEAVESYERSTRGRRTILGRVAQLRADRS